jgi:hypothetical protein
MSRKLKFPLIKFFIAKINLIKIKCSNVRSFPSATHGQISQYYLKRRNVFLILPIRRTFRRRRSIPQADAYMGQAQQENAGCQLSSFFTPFEHNSHPGFLFHATEPQQIDLPWRRRPLMRADDLLMRRRPLILSLSPQAHRSASPTTAPSTPAPTPPL